MTIDTRDWSIANPLEELAIPSAKYAGSCRCLYMGKKGLTSLGWDFEKFVSLESLWLNSNHLRSISGIEYNTRLKYLYLHGNQLSSFMENSNGTNMQYARSTNLMDSIIVNFHFLKELTLHDNKFSNLNDIINQLKHLPYLTQLNLYNNPCEQEDNYRLLVIGNLPQLQIFDRHRITDDERMAAAKLLKRLRKLNNLVISPASTISSHISRVDAAIATDRPETGTSDARLLTKEERERHKALKESIFQKVLSKLRSIFLKKRIYLEKKCEDHDKRHLNIVPREYFWDILKDADILKDINSQEKDVLLEKYCTTMLIDGQSRTGKIARQGMQYRKFFDDILGSEMRTQTPPVRGHSEISRTTKDLEKYVKKIKDSRKHDALLP